MPANARQYRIEHVEPKPRGWKVRTSLSGSHVLRIGYPPGRRRRGAGRLLEVLHPKKESSNPRCQMSEWAQKAKANPEELIIFGLNPSRKNSVQRYGVYVAGELRSVKTSLKAADKEAARLRDRGEPAQVVGPRQFFNKRLNQESPSERKRKEGETIVGACPHCEKLFTAAEVESGESLKHLSKHRGERFGESEQNPIRMRIFHDPAIKKFTASMYDEKLGNLYASGHTKKQAARALREVWRRERRQRGLNPHRRRRRHNQVSETEQAVKLFEIFHGEDPSKVTDKHVSAAMRKDYTALGKLLAIGMDDGGYGEKEIAQKWDHCSHIDFSEDHVTLASSPDGRQLYAIGGNQNLNGCLAKFEGVDPEKDFIDLGDVVFVVYEARKVHDDFEPVEYVHKFGGHGNTLPRWFYDRLKKAIFFIGGEYFIDIDAKISPGIEG